MSTISVIIPTLNRGHVIGSAIESLLAQTRRVDEIVVVDDSRTTDCTAEVCAQFGDRVRYIVQYDSGICSARNLGALVSKGDYLLFMDSDDVLYPSAIEKLAAALDSDTEYGASYCGWHMTTGPGEVVESSPLDRPSGDVFSMMCTEHLCIHQSAMVRRECLAVSGLFDSRLRQFDDIDFWIRVSAYAGFVFVPEHLAEYRRWEEGASKLGDYYDLAGKLVINTLSYFRDRGKLNKRQWKAVEYRFRGYHKDLYTALAFQAYWNKDWRKSYTYALKGFHRYPRSLLNRGVWALIIKSVIRDRTRRSIGGCTKGTG